MVPWGKECKIIKAVSGTNAAQTIILLGQACFHICYVTLLECILLNDCRSDVSPVNNSDSEVGMYQSPGDFVYVEYRAVAVSGVILG